MIRQSATLLILIGQFLVWGTACLSTPSPNPHLGDARGKRDHAVHSSHHGTAETTTVARGLSLVSTCPCGCDQRPQVAGVSIAPGLALIPAAPSLAFHAAAGFGLVESTSTALGIRGAPPDHVPLISLS